jgi:periplasmic divalent cation tolerance protein
MSPDISITYVPCGDLEEARRIARQLLEERLIACANVLSPMQSLYVWNSQIEEAQEVVLILKTLHDKRKAMLERLRRLHSYKVPCFVELAAVGVNDDYRRWMQDVLHPAPATVDDAPPWD